MNDLVIEIRRLRESIDRLNKNLPILGKEQSTTATAKRLKKESSERFERMTNFPRVEYETDQ